MSTILSNPIIIELKNIYNLRYQRNKSSKFLWELLEDIEECKPIYTSYYVTKWFWKSLEEKAVHNQDLMDTLEQALMLYKLSK